MTLTPNIRKTVPVRDPILSAYMAEVTKIPTLSVEEERGILGKMKNGDREALNALVSANLRFVVAVGWNYRKRGLPLPDLINEGNLALYRAAEHFDPSNELRFMSYAVWWIRQAMLSALARQAGPMSFPPDRMHKAIRYRRVESVLAHRLGRWPNLEEMESEFGQSARTTAAIGSVLESMSSTRGYGPIDVKVDRLALPDEDSDPAYSADLFLIRKALKSRMEGLPLKERRILSLRYGLDHGTRFSLADVGSIMGLTRERVRQIEERALVRLRRSARSATAMP